MYRHESLEVRVVISGKNHVLVSGEMALRSMKEYLVEMFKILHSIEKDMEFAYLKGIGYLAQEWRKYSLDGMQMGLRNNPALESQEEKLREYGYTLRESRWTSNRPCVLRRECELLLYLFK